MLSYFQFDAWSTRCLFALCWLLYAYSSNANGHLPISPDTDDIGFRPNIVWISTEDIGCTLAPYGDSTAHTPHINRLAQEGIVFDRAFTVAGVCAPSRSSMISGMYPTSLGTHHMRTQGIAVPEFVKPFSQYLREAGYYCTNNVKEDYNFEVGEETWDESSWKAHWRNRKPGQPFFAVFNNIVTHEHKTWYNKRNFLGIDPQKVPVPAYYPQNNQEVRKGVARVYSNIMDLDAHVGYILKQLEDAHLMDSTIIVFWSDHGGPLPRQKRELFDSGTKVPLIIRYPDGWQAGTRRDQLVSMLDLGPTMMSILGLEIPDYMQAKPFLGADSTEARDYVFLHRDRMDGQYDMVRSVRDKRYQYFRNYYPDRPNVQAIEYRLQVPLMREMVRLHEAEALSPEQEIWFNTTKPVEELYDTQTDPDEVHNLAADPAYRSKLEELRAAHLRWREETLDLGALPESEMHRIQQESGKPLYVWARENEALLGNIWETAELNSTDYSTKALEAAMQHDHPAVRYWAVYSLGNRESLPDKYRTYVREMLSHPAAAVAIAAARTLALHGEKERAVHQLQTVKNAASPEVEMMANYTLAEIGNRQETAQ